jgi:hypothetical protein
VRLTHAGSLSWGDSTDLQATPKGSAHLAGAEIVAENIVDRDADADKPCSNLTIKLPTRSALCFRAAVRREFMVPPPPSSPATPDAPATPALRVRSPSLG